MSEHRCVNCGREFGSRQEWIAHLTEEARARYRSALDQLRERDHAQHPER